MPSATYVQSSFGGGKWSAFAQGRYHDPKYRTALAVCRNIIVLETEGAVRRPGTKCAGATKGGLPGRVIRFDFEDETPAYLLEFTDGNLRPRIAAGPAETNDATAVLSISTANPAVMLLAAAVTWNTGDRGVFANAQNPLLDNRALSLTKVNTTHFSLADAITGANIDGSTLGVIGGNSTFVRFLDIATPYIGGAWASLRLVQSENTAFCLHGSFAPQALTVQQEPTIATFATFTFGAANFEDGPYLDPVTNGAQLTANQLTGIVNLTLSFPAWVATTSYAVGDLVTSGSINWQSLIDLNVNKPPIVSLTTNNTTAAGNATLHFASTTGIVDGMAVTDSTASVIPGGTTILSHTATTAVMSANATGGGVGNGDTIVFTSPTAWKQTNGNVAVNNGQGFLQTDIGRLIRLFSEPAPWAGSGSAGQIVSYNPSGLPGQTTYWSLLSGGTASNFPGKTATDWQLLLQGGANSPALWTWAKITSLINFIPGAPSGIAQVGNMTDEGGLAAAFNGNTTQNAANSAGNGSTTTFQTTMSLTGFVGQNYSGASTTAYAIQSATIFGSTDQDLVFFQATFGQKQQVLFTATAYLFGSNSPPGAWNSGTQLGSVQFDNASQVFPAGATNRGAPNGAPINIISNDQTTTYSYVWIAIVAQMQSTFTAWSSGAISFHVAQVELVAASGSASNANGIAAELLGPALLYSTAIRTWRLGRFSNTTGWPRCGTWTDARLWLSGVQPKVIDASCAEGVTTDNTGTTVNFAPTDQYGNVLASSGISIELALPEANPIEWMVPDQQGVLCGTKAREVLVFPPTAGGFAPNNIDSRMLTRIGSANIEPIRTEHTIVFVQKFVRKVVEFFADVFSGKFTAPNLIQNAKDLSEGGIQEVTYQQELAPLIWGRVNNDLIGCTYKRDTLMTSSGPTMVAWHNHDHGGGRVFESIAAGGSINGNLDALTAVTNDPATNVRFVEVLGDILDEGSTLAEAAYLDCSIVPTSTSPVAVSNGFPYGGLQLNGLWPHNGKTVTAWLGGLDCGDYVVSNGAIQVPYGDGIGGGLGAFPNLNANRGDQGLFTAAFVSTGITANGITMFTGSMPMLVGFTFTSQGQLLRPFGPAEAGTRNGPAFGKRSRSHEIMAQLEGTQGVSFGYGFAGGNPNIPPVKPAILLGPDNATRLTIDQQFTGIFRDVYACPHTYQGVQVAWQVTRPYICNVTAIGAALQTEDV